MYSLRMRARTLFLGVILSSSAAHAHMALVAPISRHAPESQLGDPQKDGPCGMLNDQRSQNNVTVYKPGQTITVMWDETIDHPGHYRICFDDNGVDAFKDPVSATDFTACGNAMLADNIPDVQGGALPHKYSKQVTLPNVTCNNCTIQVVQVMTDKAPFGNGDDIYYHCADVVLSNGPVDAGTPMDSGSPPMDSGSTPMDSGSMMTGNPDASNRPSGPIAPPGNPTNGCALGNGPVGASPIVALFALAHLLRRRNRKK